MSAAPGARPKLIRFFPLLSMSESLYGQSSGVQTFSTPAVQQTLSPRTTHRIAIGWGAATAHHGEILQGVFEDPPGRLRRALVSLGCSIFHSQARFEADGSACLRIEPPWKVKARRAAELTLSACRAPMGGSLTIDSDIPPGWGLGSSTSDVLAAVRAVTEVLGCNIGAEAVARIAVTAETASDSTILGNRAVLFAHREAVIIEDFGRTLPPLDVLGFNTDPSGAGIDTLSFPRARYTWWEIEAFRPLLGLMRKAVQDQDARLCGRVASASARINQRYLPKPHMDRLERLIEETGAAGLQVAHSGTIAGLLFDASDTDLRDRFDLGRAVVRELGFAPIWRFSTASEREGTV
jgi:uncharacterized protein involved in propanediol utilization